MALTHGLYESFRTLYIQEAAGYLHGEIVGVGLRFQPAYDGLDLVKPDTTTKTPGLPIHLKEIGAEESEAAYRLIAKELTGKNLLNHEGHSEERVVRALKAMEAK